MLEPVPNAKRVFFIDLNSDLTKVASDLGLGLLPDEMEKVKAYFEKEKENLPMLNFKPSIRRGLSIVATNLRSLS